MIRSQSLATSMRQRLPCSGHTHRMQQLVVGWRLLHRRSMPVVEAWRLLPGLMPFVKAWLQLPKWCVGLEASRLQAVRSLRRPRHFCAPQSGRLSKYGIPTRKRDVAR